MEANFNKHLGNKLKIRRIALGLTKTKVEKLNRWNSVVKEVTNMRRYYLKEFLENAEFYKKAREADPEWGEE